MYCWLGQPCTRQALLLFPGGQLQITSRCIAFLEGASTSRRRCLPVAREEEEAARSGGGAPVVRLLRSGQVQSGPAAEQRRERQQARRWRELGSSRCLLWAKALLPSLLLPASVVRPGRSSNRAGDLLLLPLPPRHTQGEAAERGRQLRASSGFTFQATGGGGGFPAGGEGGGDGSSHRPRRQDIRGCPENEITDPNKEKPNKSQQLKKVFKEYGAVGVAFHIGMSLMSLGMFYLAVSSGVDMTTILFKLGFDEALVQSKLAAGTSTFVLAYAIHKLFAPVRISITLVSVPLLVRYFRKIGFFKPPSPNP